jgi:hypothetical protein
MSKNDFWEIYLGKKYVVTIKIFKVRRQKLFFGGCEHNF